jgi:dihydrofolate reductase
MLGGTTFHVVADGIEQARAAACGKDVSLDGGANVVQQYPAAGLLDEMLISVVPVLLGGGARLSGSLGEPEAQASAHSGGRGMWNDAHPVRARNGSVTGRRP